MKDHKPKLSRRTVLKGFGALAGATAASAVVGAPHVARAQAKTIRVGMPTILSGRVALLGASSRNAAQLAIQRFNEAGGINGRTLELIVRDSRGQPDEAARVTRDLINTEGCEIIIDGEASSGGFAVHEVIRELPVLCLHSCSETSALTADPKMHVPTAFRCARQGIHDAVSGGLYAATLSRENGLTRWMTCSPDYAYGRDNTSEFLEYLKIFEPAVEVVDQAWPKLFEPDYTAFVTRIVQTRPQALYSALWGGDLVSFIEQGNLYGLFGGDMTFFSSGLADPPVIGALNQVPEGLRSVYRYDADYPDTEGNRTFNEDYVALANQAPTNWAWQNYTAAQFLFAALERTGGQTDGLVLAEALKGLELESPFAEAGKITMRAEDHTIIGYPVAWGSSVASPPGFTDWVPGDWPQILEQEAEWKKRMGYA